MMLSTTIILEINRFPPFPIQKRLFISQLIFYQYAKKIVHALTAHSDFCLFAVMDAAIASLQCHERRITRRFLFAGRAYKIRIWTGVFCDIPLSGLKPLQEFWHFLTPNLFLLLQRTIFCCQGASKKEKAVLVRVGVSPLGKSRLTFVLLTLAWFLILDISYHTEICESRWVYRQNEKIFLSVTLTDYICFSSGQAAEIP